ncbi:MAG: RNA polymerase factor sigma-54 [Pseudomonadota bacterium]
MALTQRLDLRQTQSLAMTPQLQQAIKLLQLSNLELVAYVEKELAENPLLEPATEDAAAAPEIESDQANSTAAAETPVVATDRVAENATASDVADQALDLDSTEIWTGERPADSLEVPETESGWHLGSWGEAGSPLRSSSDGFDWQDIASAPETLRDHLLRQAHTAIEDAETRLVAAYLVDCLDDAGYLTASSEEIANALGVEPALVDVALGHCQQFDPPGLFARSLRECLALQLAERDRLDPAMATMLDNLNLLAERNYAALSRVCRQDRSDIIDMVTEIRALDPKPAQRFAGGASPVVVPDVMVRSDGANGWLIQLNHDTLPRVLVNRDYHASIRQTAKSPADRNYLNDRLASANWLVKALDQRATTILRVATEIVRRQSDFLHHGVSGLKPLILRDIADEIEMHESTVSRVTSNKFIATPRGMFELKYFFSTALASTEGEDAHSAEMVRHRIKTLIADESPDEVLSDDRIAAMLGTCGIDIARRTVAKYREGMNIPSSTRRRREKSLSA